MSRIVSFKKMLHLCLKSRSTTVPVIVDHNGDNLVTLKVLNPLKYWKFYSVNCIYYLFT